MKTFLTFLISCLFSGFSHAQPAEAISVHFDKDIYLPGEKIWFKAYIYNGSNLSSLSTNFYTGIYTEDGKLIQQKQYPILDGSTNGDFEIPDTLRSAGLQFVAFTRQTELPAFHYKKSLHLYQRGKPLSESSSLVGIPLLKVLPEGGNLVAGLINYVVISSEYNSGAPFPAAGAIVETQTNRLVDSFYTNENGLARIQFMPMAGATYKATWSSPEGKSQEFMIPVAPDGKVSLHAELANRKLHYIINRLPGNSSPSLEKLELQILSASDTFYQAKISMNKTSNVISSIPVDSLHAGIYTLRLSDMVRRVLQEKTFIISEENLPISINLKIKSDLPKGKNIIEISFPDTSMYNLSLSIASENFYNNESRRSIHEELILREGISFAGKKESLFAGTSSLMELLAGSLRTRIYGRPVYSKADKFISFQVQTSSHNGISDKDQLNILVKDQVSSPAFYSAKKISTHSYEVADLIYYDTSNVYYKINSNDPLTKTLVFFRTDSINLSKKIDPLISSSIYAKAASPADQSVLQIFQERKPGRFNEMQTIQNVVVKSRYVNPETKRIQALDDQYSTGMFKGVTRGYQLNVVDDEKAWASSDILTYVSNKIPGLRVISSGMQRGLYAMSRETFSPVLVMTFLDEMELPNQEGLDNVQMKDVAYIKYTPGIVIGSSFRTSEGVLFVYTRKGKDLSSTIPGMSVRPSKGYSLAADFALPDYSDKSAQVNPDYRTTLYWNPYLVPDQPRGRKITIEYYNNDITKQVLLRMQGINSKGRLISVEKVL